MTPLLTLLAYVFAVVMALGAAVLGFETAPDLLVGAAEGAVSAALYGAVWFFKNRRRNRESFDRLKFGATVLVGAGVGVALYLGGQDVSALAVEQRLAAYVGVISLVEAVLKSLRKSGVVQSDEGRKVMPDGGFDLGTLMDPSAAEQLKGEPCPECGEPMDLGSLRWNGRVWEHKSDEAHPQAGHHALTDPSDHEAEWLGSLVGATIREPGPDADGPVLELHGEQGSAAVEFDDVELTHALADAADRLFAAHPDGGAARGDAVADGGRRLTANPERCDECGAHLDENGECPAADEPGHGGSR